jgi:peptidoglycan/xylan/chitin deacetylase (PgdA/CDA1 family)
VLVLGLKPTYMRPPYGECNDSCRATLLKLGYQIIYWGLDPLDWARPNITSILEAFDLVQDLEKELKATTGVGIVLMHDTLQLTVEVLLPMILEYFNSRSYEFVSVAECLGQSKDHWYKNV